MDLATLPPELALTIGRQLVVPDILRWSQTSSYWRNFLLDEALWKWLYHRDIADVCSFSTYRQAYEKLDPIRRRLDDRSPLQGLTKAAESGYSELIDRYVNKYRTTRVELHHHFTTQFPSPEPEPWNPQDRSIDEIYPIVMSAAKGRHDRLLESSIVSISADIWSRIQADRHFKFLMKDIATCGRLDLFDAALEKSRTNAINWMTLWNAGLHGAAYGGHTELVDHLLHRGATDLDGALANAASGGHVTLVEDLLSRGATDLNAALYSAAGSGHWNLVIKLLDQGATDLYIGLLGAVHSHQMILVKFFLERGAAVGQMHVFSACWTGNLAIVQHLVAECQRDNLPIDLNESLRRAAKAGHLHLIDWLIQQGATNLEHPIFSATICGHHHVLRRLIDHLPQPHSLNPATLMEALNRTVQNGDRVSFDLIHSLMLPPA